MICLNHSRLHNSEQDAFKANRLHQLLIDWRMPWQRFRLAKACELTAHSGHTKAVDEWMAKHFKEERYAWTIGWREEKEAAEDVSAGLTLCLMVNLGKPKGCPNEGDLFAVLPFEIDADGLGIGTVHLMRFELHAHRVNRKRCSLMAMPADRAEQLFQCCAFPLLDDTTEPWRAAWKSNHDSRMLRKVFDELGKSASMDVTPDDSEFEIEPERNSARGILEWVDLVHGAGKSIDWKMRLRDGAYRSQITSEELTGQMLSILREIKDESPTGCIRPTMHFAKVARRKGASGMLLDAIQRNAKMRGDNAWMMFQDECYYARCVGETAEDWLVPVSEELLHAVNWCVNYHIGPERQSKHGNKSVLITMDLQDWRKQGKPLVRKLKAEGFASIAVMMAGKPEDSPEWREVHHVQPHDATYLAAHPEAVHLPPFSVHLHRSRDSHVAKCLRELGPEVTPLIVDRDALRSWRGSYYDRLDLPWSSASIASDLMRLAMQLECGCKLVNRDEPGWFFTLQRPRYEADEPRGRASWLIGQPLTPWDLAVKILRGETPKITSSASRIGWRVGVAKDTVLCDWGYPVLMVVARDREDMNRRVLLISDRGWEWLRANKETGLPLWYKWMKPLLRSGVRLRRVSDFTANLATFTQDLPLDRPITAEFAAQAIHQRMHGWFH